MVVEIVNGSYYKALSTDILPSSIPVGAFILETDTNVSYQITPLGKRPVAAARQGREDVPVNFNADHWPVLFSAPEIDTNYFAMVGTSWATGYVITDKTVNGFTVQFTTKAPASGPISTMTWMLMKKPVV